MNMKRLFAATCVLWMTSVAGAVIFFSVNDLIIDCGNPIHALQENSSIEVINVKVMMDGFDGVCPASIINSSDDNYFYPLVISVS